MYFTDIVVNNNSSEIRTETKYYSYIVLYSTGLSFCQLMYLLSLNNMNNIKSCRSKYLLDLFFGKALIITYIPI